MRSFWSNEFSFNPRRQCPYALRSVLPQYPQSRPLNSANADSFENRSFLPSGSRTSSVAFRSCSFIQTIRAVMIWGRYHRGRQPSSDDNPTVIPPLAHDKPSIVKLYHRRRTCSHTSPRRSPTMVTLHDTRFVECRWWNDGWTVKTVVT